MVNDFFGLDQKAKFDHDLLSKGKIVVTHKDLTDRSNSDLQFRAIKDDRVFKFSQRFDLKNGDFIELKEDRSLWQVLFVEDYRVGHVFVSFNAITTPKDSPGLNSPREIEITEADTPQEKEQLTIASNKKVFIVHGHDVAARTELELLLFREKLEPIILDQQANAGMTIIEKLEKNSDVGYAFILMTPDEIAYLAKQDDKSDEQRSKEFRPRPNVWIELGYFLGRLNRKRLCFLVRGDVRLPSDLGGIVYLKFSESLEDIKKEILKELKGAGYLFS